ncbi:Z-ring formation inhibitor MciZ [Aeribacillus pallidus]|jgi:hypothetical protein|nr:Z-ring formation inhibitor MciZ [Bacillus sp. (in: firmicutes)]
MKVYIHKKGITLTGKAWEIRHQLKRMNKRYKRVIDFVEQMYPK